MSQIEHFRHLRFKNVPLKTENYHYLKKRQSLHKKQNQNKKRWNFLISSIQYSRLVSHLPPISVIPKQPRVSAAGKRPSEASTSNAARNHSTAAKPITGVWRASCCAAHANTRFEMDRDGTPSDLSLSLSLSLLKVKRKNKAAAKSRGGREGGSEKEVEVGRYKRL